MVQREVTVDALLAQRGWVRALARTLVADEHRASDVEQDAWLAALRRPPLEGGSLRAWFASVVRSRVRDQHRVETHRSERETAAARPEALPSAADVAASTEIHRRLVSAVLALEEPYRSAVILRYFEDLPPREIAARTGVPVETARTRVKRGIERLRERLDGETGGDRRAWCALLLPIAGRRSNDLVWTGGAIVAKKSAALAVLLLLVLATGAGVWFAARSGASSVVADGGIPPRETADAARPPRPERVRSEETPAVAADAASAVVEAKPDRPVVEVLDSVTRQPIEGARLVVAYANGETQRLNGYRAHGRFLLDPDLAGSSATVWALADGYARRRIADAELSAGVLSIALDRAEPPQLRFVTETGRVLDAAQVRTLFGDEIGDISSEAFEIVSDDALRGGDVSRMLRLLFGAAGDWHTYVPVAGDGSSMRLAEAVSSGRWRLFVRRPGATPWLSEPFDGGTAAIVTIPLPEVSRTRRVLVVADDTDEPLASAQLVPWYEHGDGEAFLSGTSVHADAHGVAVLPIDPPGVRPPTWWVHAGLHEPERSGMVDAASLGRPEIGDLLRVALPKTAVVEGEAYLPSGQPAAGSLVVTGGKGMVWRAIVDADGRFQFERAPVIDGAVDVMMLGTGTFTQTRAVFGPDGVAHAVIGTKAADGARGRIIGVLTAGGAPVAGAVVLDQPVNAKGSFVRTDANGRFALEGLDVSIEHDVCIYAGDPRASEDHSRIRTMSPLRLDAAKPLEFTFDLPAGVVRVRVLDAGTGKPVAAARVLGGPVDAAPDRARFAGFECRGGWAAYTADDGTLLLRALVPGASHTVEVSADGYESASREGVVPGSLAAPAKLEIRLARK